jgi:DNA-binding MarR family transcriptional regulator
MEQQFNSPDCWSDGAYYGMLLRAVWGIAHCDRTNEIWRGVRRSRQIGAESMPKSEHRASSTREVSSSRAVSKLKSPNSRLSARQRADFDVREYIPYLIYRASNGLTESFAPGLQPFKLSLGMWRVLALLYGHGPLRFSALVTLSSLEPPTVSRFIGQLIDRRLITKSKTNDDGRGVNIDITEKGLEVVKQIIPHAIEMQKRMLSSFSEDEANLLRHLLQQLCENVAPLKPFDDT